MAKSSLLTFPHFSRKYKVWYWQCFQLPNSLRVSWSVMETTNFWQIWKLAKSNSQIFWIDTNWSIPSQSTYTYHAWKTGPVLSCLKWQAASSSAEVGRGWPGGSGGWLRQPGNRRLGGREIRMDTQSIKMNPQPPWVGDRRAICVQRCRRIGLSCQLTQIHPIWWWWWCWW
mgnify:CR=1 FL=1